MLRAAFGGLALMLGALTCLPHDVSAAGRGQGVGARAGTGVHLGGAGWRGMGPRIQHARPHGRHGHARHRGRFFGGPGFVGHVPFAPPVGVRETEIRRAAPVDPFAFANLPVRMGIPYPPRPEPTLYRIEGRRDRPVVRVIRIADRQAHGTTRGLHAETGALLLTVPERR
jgi:hypothetical protein